MKYLALLLLLSLPSCTPCDLGALAESPIITDATTFFNNASTMSRESSVKVIVLTDRDTIGHGSGAYVTYRGKFYILTAYHVIHDMIRAVAVDGKSSHFMEPALIHRESDTALLAVEEIPNKKPLRLKLSSRDLPKIGAEVIYTGYPNLTGPLTVEGTVAGFASDGAIILQSYAWGGASGSAVLNKRGEVLGVLSGIELGKDYRGIVVQNSSIVIVNPIPRDFLEVVDDLYHK